MKHTPRVFMGLAAGLALVLFGGGAAIPALANKAPQPCEPVTGAAIRQDTVNSLQMAGDMVASTTTTHSAAFAETGMQFTSTTNKEETAVGVGMTLAKVIQGGQSVRIKARPSGTKGSTRTWTVCNNLAYRERAKGLIEAVGVYGDHVDLAYVLQKPLFKKRSNKDLALTVNLDTSLRAEQTASGILLTDKYLNGVLIGMPTAVDAEGKSQPLEMTGDENALTITVPGKWLAKAKYPVTIDPVVATWSHSSDAQYDPFIAYDTSDKTRALVVFTDKVGNDYDVGYRLINAQTGNTLAQGMVPDTGKETTPVVTFNPNGPTGAEYLVAYARGDRLFAHRIDADNGALIGGEIANKEVKLQGGTVSDAAIDPAGGRMLVVWVNTPQPADLKGVIINEAGSFASTGFEIAGTPYDERHPHVTFDPKLSKKGSFVVSWKQTNKNSYSILARTVNYKGTSLGSVVTLKSASSVNVTNRKIIFSADADNEGTNPGKFLAVWNRVDNNDLVGLLLNNRDSKKLNTLVVSGKNFVINAGKSKGWKFNDKTDVFPDLSSAGKGWVVVWRETDNTTLPAYNYIHWVKINEKGKVGTIGDVAQFDAADTVASNPVVIVLTSGTILTVHEVIPQSSGVNTLVVSTN